MTQVERHHDTCHRAKHKLLRSGKHSYDLTAMFAKRRPGGSRRVIKLLIQMLTVGKYVSISWYLHVQACRRYIYLPLHQM